MKFKRHRFSLLEVILVVIIMAIVMGIAVHSFLKNSPTEAKLEMEDNLTRIFGSAAIRSRAFGLKVRVTFITDGESAIKCTLVNEEINPELPVISSEDETEEQFTTRRQDEVNSEVWGGEDEYTFPSEIRLLNFKDIVNEEDEIIFRFFPGGEAVGPKEALRLAIGDMEFTVNIDRLMGQLIVKRIEEL